MTSLLPRPDDGRDDAGWAGKDFAFAFPLLRAGLACTRLVAGFAFAGPGACLTSAAGEPARLSDIPNMAPVQREAHNTKECA